MNRVDVYQSVTDRIVTAIENGATAPWRMPWVGGGPVNVSNGRRYRGINVFLLTMMGAAHGYDEQRWGTFKAFKAVGASVRKGEKATWVILWKPVPKKRGEDDEQSNYMLLKTFPVFNACQCDGVPERVDTFEHDPIERAEEIFRGYEGPAYTFLADSAYYSPTQDLVACPQLAMFERVEGYYSTLYHEIVHSTGHESRLDRLERTGFGSGPYAKEELVAEMGAAMLCGLAGIDNLDQSAAYVKGWIRRLEDDPKFVVNAAAQAQKAADMILGEAFSQATENREPEVVAA